MVALKLRKVETLTASEADAAQAVLELAAGTIDEASFCGFMRAKVEPTEREAFT